VLFRRVKQIYHVSDYHLLSDISRQIYHEKSHVARQWQHGERFQLQIVAKLPDALNISAAFGCRRHAKTARYPATYHDVIYIPGNGDWSERPAGRPLRLSDQSRHWDFVLIVHDFAEFGSDPRIVLIAVHSNRRTKRSTGTTIGIRCCRSKTHTAIRRK